MTVIDVAGAPFGGSARWRREAQAWIARQEPSGVRLIGLDERVEPRWLARRELLDRHEHRIAANNLGYITGSKGRTVLLRNPLHFLWPGEAATIPTLSASLRRQAVFIRGCARRADLIVVPSSHMAERVSAAAPYLTSRLVVRHHPLSPLERAVPSSPPYILYPSIPAPHKNLEAGLEALLAGVLLSGLPLVIKITSPPKYLPNLCDHPRIDAIGVQPMAEMDRLWASATASYMPYTVESFCYPLAEARSAGIPVIARDTVENREVGGAAIVGFDADDAEAVAAALTKAATYRPQPDPSPFDPDSYFSWLVER